MEGATWGVQNWEAYAKSMLETAAKDSKLMGLTSATRLSGFPCREAIEDDDADDVAHSNDAAQADPSKMACAFDAGQGKDDEDGEDQGDGVPFHDNGEDKV